MGVQDHDTGLLSVSKDTIYFETPVTKIEDALNSNPTDNKATVFKPFSFKRIKQ